MAVTDTSEPLFNYSASSSDQSETSQRGPLKQLRISSLSPEVHSSARPKPVKIRKDKKNRTYQKQIQAKKSSHDAGFGFEIDFPQSDRTNSETTLQNMAGHDSSQMATIFLTSAKALKSKYHVVDAVQNKDSSPLLKSPEGVPVHISPVVRRRAEIVKSTLELKYTWLQRVAVPNEDDQLIHPGFDNCYNPLQVLRNRVTRKKLNHPLPSPAQNPLPCDAFSSHQSVSGKPWKMLWGIDLNEQVADFAWRKVYWTELRNARGEYWFPEAAAPHTSKHGKISRKLHDKLWNESDNEKLQEENFVSQIPFQSRKDHGPKGLKNNWKEKAKRLYGYQSSSAVDLRNTNDSYHAPSKSLDGLSAVKIARIARSNSSENTAPSYRFKLGGSGEFDTSSNENGSKTSLNRDAVQPPQIIIGDGSGSDILEEHVDGTEGLIDQNDHINDVCFFPAHGKAPSVQHIEGSFANRSSISVDAGPLHSSFSDDTQLQAVGKSLNYLKVISFLNLNYLDAIYPVLLESTRLKLDTRLQVDMRQLLRSINQVNAGLLPGREALYKGFIEEAKSITHLANDDCAVKIDNLLSATDRSYGELNTSLIMELRKTNEKLDKLNRSLFSGVINSATIDRTQEYDISDHRYLYIALENVIVVFLRLVWIGVNIFKPVFIFMKIVWKLITMFIR